MNDSMKDEMTREQAEACAALVHALRPSWDARGIVAALGKAKGRDSALAVSVSVLLAAGSDQVHTPAVVHGDERWLRRAREALGGRSDAGGSYARPNPDAEWRKLGGGVRPPEDFWELVEQARREAGQGA